MFDPKQYSASIAENASIGASVLQVRRIELVVKRIEKSKTLNFQNSKYYHKIRYQQQTLMKVQTVVLDFLYQVVTKTEILAFLKIPVLFELQRISITNENLAMF